MHPSAGPNSTAESLPIAPSAGPDVARLTALAAEIKAWGLALGFQQVGIADTALGLAEARLLDWLRRGHHGEMGFMARHGTRRSRPAELVPGTVRVISARMDYLPEDQAAMRRASRTRPPPSSPATPRARLPQAPAPAPAGLADRIVAPSAPSATGSSWTRPRSWRNPWRRRPGSAGSASTPTWSARDGVLVLPRRGLYRPAPARGRPGGRPLRNLPCLHRRLPHPGHRRPLCPRRPSVHLLPDHRAQGPHSRSP